MKRQKFIPAVLLGVALLSAGVGIAPLFRGGAVNAVFIAVAGVWLIIALAVMKAQRTGSTSDAP